MGGAGLRVGVVCQAGKGSSVSRQLAGLAISWLVGDDGELSCPVFADLDQAVAEMPVDVVVDCTGQVGPRQDVDVIGLNTARGLLTASSPRSAGETVAQLKEHIARVTRYIDDMHNYSRRLAEAGSQLQGVAQGILDALAQTGKMLDSITRIAKRSKIIGLNSAIEASRAGETGRGFLIVAEEIKNLADDSSRFVREIEKVLDGIQRRSDDFAQRINVVQEVSVRQRQATEEITALLAVLRELGEELDQLGDDVA